MASRSIDDLVSEMRPMARTLMRTSIFTFVVAALVISSGIGVTPLASKAPSPLVSSAGDPVFIGAGDIGECPLSNGKYKPKNTKAEATAKAVADLLPADPAMGVVFIAGDNAYGKGTAKQYAECYDPTWGRFKDRTRPVPGNHEFIRDNRPESTWFGKDYFDYFGEERAGKRFEGYYSYQLGAWHIIALNSELQKKFMEKQLKWLSEDLSKNKQPCALAYWHRPVFSSGEHGAGHTPPGIERTMQAAWRILDENGVDIVVNGHDHNYERFHPQDANGNPNPNGIVEFVVGTGGVGLRETEIPPGKRRNSAAFNKVTWGVLKLTLHPSSYDYEFVPVATKTSAAPFRDDSPASVPCVP